MVKHIVMWKFKEDTAEADKLEMKQRLEALKGVVPTLVDIEVGMDLSNKEASMDMGALFRFERRQVLWPGRANKPLNIPHCRAQRQGPAEFR